MLTVGPKKRLRNLKYS